jgi:hypothetical protein
MLSTHHRAVRAGLGSGASVLAALVVATTTVRARACGVSGPDGVSACSLAEHEEATRPRWHVGSSAVFTSTALRFDGDLRAEETRFAVLALVAYAPTAHVTLHAGAGAALGGSLGLPDGSHEFLPGPALALGASWRVVDGAPFVVLSSQLTSLLSTTRAPGAAESGVTSTTGYEAFDLRLGITVGTTVLDVVSPYAIARVFGGPVFWRYQGSAVTGTDVSHYQIGAGFAARAGKRFDLFGEGIPLGERAVAFGAGVAF